MSFTLDLPRHLVACPRMRVDTEPSGETDPLAPFFLSIECLRGPCGVQVMTIFVTHGRNLGVGGNCYNEHDDSDRGMKG